jgi:8-amino-3,8-dideoxy-alpha-D-manno-octulosonate transaminase
MPGYEVFGNEERAAINDLFDLNGGVLFAHGFDGIRNNIYRVREFEAAFSKHVGCPYAQAVSSGSSALKVALKALGIGPGDEVITTAFTFVATVEAIFEVGAIPVLVDINDTLNIDPKAITEHITENTKAILVVHMMGAPAQMDEILMIAKNNELYVIEDNAQTCGGSYNGEMLGTLGDIGTFSFDAGKVLTTGEGGMVVTRNKEFYLRARAYHDHGHVYDRDLGRAQEHALMLGFNYRMTELQGAIGIVQLNKLEHIIAKQRQNKKRLKEKLAGLSLSFRSICDEVGEIGDSLIFFGDAKIQTDRVFEMLQQAGIGTKNLPDAIRWHFARYWDHIYSGERQGLRRSDGWEKSAKLLECAIAIPVMVNMTDDRIDHVAANIKKAIEVS